MNIFTQKAISFSFSVLSFFLLIILIVGGVSSSGYCSEVTLTWSSPIHIDVPIDGYKIYYNEGRPDFDNAWVEKVVGRDNTEITIRGLEEGRTYYFAATSYREIPGGPDIESAYSAYAQYRVPGEYSGNSRSSSACFVLSLVD